MLNIVYMEMPVVMVYMVARFVVLMLLLQNVVGTRVARFILQARYF